MNADYYLENNDTAEKIKPLREAFDAVEPEFDSTHLKLEINEIVWRNAAQSTTLAEAEDMATEFWGKIMETHSK